MVDLAARTGCKGSPARTSVPNHDRREGISFRSGAPGWRCLALAHLRLLDEWPATTTANAGIFRFIQGRPHNVGVVAGVFPIIADESEAGIGVFPHLPVEVFADDSPHPFPIHFPDEFLAIASEFQGRDVRIGFEVEAIALQVLERTHFVGHQAEPDIATLRVDWFPARILGDFVFLPFHTGAGIGQSPLGRKASFPLALITPKQFLLAFGHSHDCTSKSAEWDFRTPRAGLRAGARMARISRSKSSSVRNARSFSSRRTNASNITSTTACSH